MEQHLKSSSVTLKVQRLLRNRSPMMSLPCLNPVLASHCSKDKPWPHPPTGLAPNGSGTSVPSPFWPHRPQGPPAELVPPSSLIAPSAWALCSQISTWLSSYHYSHFNSDTTSSGTPSRVDTIPSATVTPVPRSSLSSS